MKPLKLVINSKLMLANLKKLMSILYRRTEKIINEHSSLAKGKNLKKKESFKARIVLKVMG
jgi:hypothetical protein